jgi:superfamily II DNA helicase RecQ
VKPSPFFRPQVISYAEDCFECRRVLMLHYFGERHFSRSHCGATCDNCERAAVAGAPTVQEMDVSALARAAVGAVGGAGNRARLTLAMLVDCLKGCATERGGLGVRREGASGRSQETGKGRMGVAPRPSAGYA